jgi:hypothetical protein
MYLPAAVKGLSMGVHVESYLLWILVTDKQEVFFQKCFQIQNSDSHVWM